MVDSCLHYSIPPVRVLKDWNTALTGSQPGSTAMVTPWSFIILFYIQDTKADSMGLIPSFPAGMWKEEYRCARSGLLGTLGIYPNPEVKTSISTYLATIWNEWLNDLTQLVVFIFNFFLLSLTLFELPFTVLTALFKYCLLLYIS